MQLFLNVLIFNICLSKGEKEENKEGVGRHHPFKSLEVTSVRGEELAAMQGVQQQWPSAYLFDPCDQKQQSVKRTQIFSIWRTRSFLPTQAPVSCVKTALRTCTQLFAMMWRGENWYPLN